MLFGGVFGLIAIAIWIYCVVDVIRTPADQVRNLPKLAWIFLVILLVEFGAIVWLLAGRPWNRAERAARTPDVRERPTRSAGGGHGSFGSSLSRAKTRPTNPDDDDEFLASLSQRAAQQRAEVERRARDDEGGATPPV